MADTPSPLEAAARAIHAEYGHPDTVGYWPCSLCLTRARVALLAAIEALSEEAYSTFREGRAAVEFECDRCGLADVVSKAGLRRAFGLGDQP